jgi:hypothetical protein
LDHTRISRESAAVDEALERLQEVVGDITPDSLVEAGLVALFTSSFCSWNTRFNR